MILEIEELHQKDVMAVSKLIDRSFSRSVASTLTNEGVSTFMSGLTSESIEKRLASGNTFIVCRNENSIVGVAEIRDKNHLNLLFVEPSIQRKGIGRKLLLNLVDRVQESQITVNSSLNSVDAYIKFGFHQGGDFAACKTKYFFSFLFCLKKKETMPREINIYIDISHNTILIRFYYTICDHPQSGFILISTVFWENSCLTR